MTTDLDLALDRLRLAVRPSYADPVNIENSCRAYIAERERERSRAITVDSMIPVSLDDLDEPLPCGATNVDANGTEVTP